MLTGQNFDDTEKRTTGGKNGYGAKLANIFSRKFTLETADQKKKKTFKMTWYDNMSRNDDPIISAFDPESFVGTRITFLPDYERFSMKGLTNDLVSLLKRRTYDIAATTPSAIKVYFNDRTIPVKSITDYATLAIEGKTSYVRS
jgi:DNA topoisomerase-2